MVNIVSWNTRGACMPKLNTYYGSLLKSGDKNHIIMIQEAGAIEKIGVFDLTLGTSSRGHFFKGFFLPQEGAGNPRCTTGILAETELDENHIFNYFNPVKTLEIGKRPIVYYEHKLLNFTTKIKEKCILATVHLTANETKAVEELDFLNISFKYQFDSCAHWLVMGDFNCEPKTLNPESFGANILYTDEPTFQSGKTLDFVLFSDSLRGRVSKPKVIKMDGYYISPGSDHYPVTCQIL